MNPEQFKEFMAVFMQIAATSRDIRAGTDNTISPVGV
jgi:hypothetical protein